MSQRPIVVGVDDSPHTQAAVHWALTEARTRTAPVRLVTAYRFAPPYQGDAMYTGLTESSVRDIKRAADEVIARAVNDATEFSPDVKVSCEVIDGSATQVLIDESAHAGTIVLGSRHLKALGSALLGSVGASVAARAKCPVVVMRGPAGLIAERAAVVVGIDGTDETEPALEFGFDHASRHGVPLRAVHCVRPELLASMQWRPESPAPARIVDWLEETLVGWREKYPHVDAHGAVVRDQPVTGLVTASNAQHLLVVRSRTRHAFSGSLLGSVSQGVLHRATCPVAVIPAGVN
jgi:nucleotide-binding universal stress UspA family protein